LRPLPVRPALLLLPLVLAAACARPAPAAAASAPAWTGVSARITSAMTALQAPDGSFPEYLAGTPQPYGEAMIGYGLLLHGLRTGERPAIVSGLRAVDHAVASGNPRGDGLDSVFKQLAVASAYTLAAARLSGDAAVEVRRAQWAAWLRRVRFIHLGVGRGSGNKHLVEAVADLEILRSGIAGGEPGSVLADPAGARQRILALVNSRWPAAVAAQTRRGPLGPIAVASDAPTHPLAYHGLSLAMLDRAVELLGRAAAPAAHTALRRMARASWTLTAPDGDLAYWGRSQEQSWALALTAAGAAPLALDGGAGAGRAAALRARLAGRVADVHGFGINGVWIVPALRRDAAAGRAAMDDYAANGVYNGLTLVGAEWTLEDLEAGEAPAGALAADHQGEWEIGRGLASFAVVRRGGVWFAVRTRAATGAHTADARYSFGLMSVKRRSRSGWTDVVAPAPRGGDSPGPRLLLAGGRVAEAFGTRVELRRGGVVVVHGGFRTAGGAIVRHGVRFTYRPTRAGVELSFPVRAGDVTEVADFRPASTATAPVDVRVSPPPARARGLRSAPAIRDGFASATLGAVVRVSERVRARRGGTLTWSPRGY
jgi:hypothetical protein